MELQWAERRGLTRLLPKGLPLRDESWASRHRVIVLLLWGHVAAILAYSLQQGQTLEHSIFEAGAVALFAGVATQARFGGRRSRALSAVLGLLLSSATLVHLSNGLTEMHFHFFVMVAVITLYQDWTTFAVAIGFVAVHHAVLGSLHPAAVFNHGSASGNPLKWAAVHAGFVLSASAAQVASWRFVEDEVHRAKDEIGRRERRFRSLIDNSSDGVWIVTADGFLAYESPAVAGMLGHHESERLGGSAIDLIHPDDVDRCRLLFGELLLAPRRHSTRFEARVQHGDGSWRWLDAQATNLLGEPDVNGIVVNFHDVTDRKALERRLSHQAFHDSLTGLANRALFLDRVEHALATRDRRAEHLAVLYIDLDDFKTFNDALGHEAGDEVLVSASQRLLAELRPTDTCARLGGDEFAILLEDLAHPGEAYDLGVRLLVALAEPTVIAGSSITLNASLGIVLASSDDDAPSLLRNADLAMYHAKSGGKGRYEIFERGMYDAVVERLTLRSEMRRGVEAGEFVAHYQPIVNLGTGEIVAAEALVRWHHPERGCLTPAAFIDTAEDSGLIIDIGRQVLAQACRDVTTWPNSSAGPMGISVNLSARQLQTRQLVDEVRDVLTDAALDPERLTLELTETVLLDDPDAALATIQQLKELGVLIALDDFGTGYSSLSYLRRFPVDRLKIDKSFVDALGGGGLPADASLVGAIIGLGELLSLQVTAEGIELHGQVADLVALGCHLGQGYYFARPVPPGQIRDVLNDNHQAISVLEDLLDSIDAPGDQVFAADTSPSAVRAVNS